MILGLNVNEGCYYIKVVYLKLIHLKMMKCEHGFYINHDRRHLIELLYPGHEKKQYMIMMSRMLLICFIIRIFIALMFVIVIGKVM